MHHITYYRQLARNLLSERTLRNPEPLVEQVAQVLFLASNDAAQKVVFYEKKRREKALKHLGNFMLKCMEREVPLSRALQEEVLIVDRTLRNNRSA